MIDWNAIGSRAWRGAIIGAVVSLIATPFIAATLVFLGEPIFGGIALMFAEGLILGAISNGLGEFIKQVGWQT